MPPSCCSPASTTRLPLTSGERRLHAAWDAPLACCLHPLVTAEQLFQDSHLLSCPAACSLSHRVKSDTIATGQPLIGHPSNLGLVCCAGLRPSSAALGQAQPSICCTAACSQPVHTSHHAEPERLPFTDPGMYLQARLSRLKRLAYRTLCMQVGGLHTSRAPSEEAALSREGLH